MIHEEICTYEVCKLAKEKGFNEKCYHYYQNGVLESDECFNRYNKGVDGICSAPTQSILQRWLREGKGVHIVIESEPTTTTSSNMLFQWIINYNSDGECYDCYNDIRAYPSYEKTLESALKFALENLV